MFNSNILFPNGKILSVTLVCMASVGPDCTWMRLNQGDSGLHNTHSLVWESGMGSINYNDLATTYKGLNYVLFNTCEGEATECSGSTHTVDHSH